MKKNILFIVIGVVIGSASVVAGANYLYNAKEVSYKSTTVEAAVEDLYGSAENLNTSISNLKSITDVLNEVKSSNIEIISTYRYNNIAFPIKKVGNICFLTVSVLQNLPQNKSTVIGTVPDYCKPKTDASITTVQDNGGLCRLNFNISSSDGQLTVYNYCSYSNAMNIADTLAYPIV